MTQIFQYKFFMRRILGFICIVTILCCLAGVANTQADISRTQQWRADLQYLSDTLQAEHPNLFFQVDKETFYKAVEDLTLNIPTMTDTEIKVEIARILALCGDGHTQLPLRQRAVSQVIFPFQLYWFSEGIYVIAATDEHKELIGKKVCKINGLPVEQVVKRIIPLISHENQTWLKYYVPRYMSYPAVLEGLHIIEYEVNPLK